MTSEPMDKKRRTKKGTNKVIPMTTPMAIADESSIINHSMMVSEQDYEYELSVIADMEKQEREFMKNMQIELEKQLETRDFHIKQVLRKLKLGHATGDEERAYICLLEVWMESQDTNIHSELYDAFIKYIRTKIRIPADTIEYMASNIRAN